MTQQQLEQNGYKVWINHIRPFDEEGRPFAKGGVTNVIILRPEDSAPVAFGEAYCSKNDTFNKKMGRQIALGRAICDLTGEAERRRRRNGNH